MEAVWTVAQQHTKLENEAVYNIAISLHNSALSPFSSALVVVGVNISAHSSFKKAVGSIETTVKILTCTTWSTINAPSNSCTYQ